ncbi:MAG TPA: VOC family protein [Vineibacter sp.]|nr:VOC family protein [Vineibacter sp.]
MAQHLTGIDHCVILVRDLDSAAATWRRLGFTLSPRGTHSAHMGSANHTIMLQRDYFELLGVINPTEHNKMWRDEIARGEGLTAVALQTDDADKACAEIRGMDIAAGDVVAFSRPVDLPGGGKGEAAFRVTNFPADLLPGMHLFVCGQLTRETVWIPELMVHTNGAQALAALVMACADPEAMASRWARVLGRQAIATVPGGARVTVGSAAVELLAPSALAGRFAGVSVDGSRDRLVGLSIRVAELSRARAALAAGKIAARETPGRIVVSPADANGAALEFVA